ncbi:unnamed protein product [Closterium sp. Naga37s-1]|nr:unnamed protein product [Closterium sp. Naga37s-1]
MTALLDRMLRYLTRVMDVATPTADCLTLIHQLLAPVLHAHDSDGSSVTKQESAASGTALSSCSTIHCYATVCSPLCFSSPPLSLPTPGAHASRHGGMGGDLLQHRSPPLCTFLFSLQSHFPLPLQARMLADMEERVGDLLQLTFESYKSLSESSPSGIADSSRSATHLCASLGRSLVGAEAAALVAPAIPPAVHLFGLLNDLLLPEVQQQFCGYLQVRRGGGMGEYWQMKGGCLGGAEAVAALVAPAIPPAVHLFGLLHDLLLPEVQQQFCGYLQVSLGYYWEQGCKGWGRALGRSLVGAEAAALVTPAIPPAVYLFGLLNDLLLPEVQQQFCGYLQVRQGWGCWQIRTAARRRCRQHLSETGEYVNGTFCVLVLPSHLPHSPLPSHTDSSEAAVPATLVRDGRTAARRRCRQHLSETDEYVNGTFCLGTGGSTMQAQAQGQAGMGCSPGGGRGRGGGGGGGMGGAGGMGRGAMRGGEGGDMEEQREAYGSMRLACVAMWREVQADIGIHNQHILPRGASACVAMWREMQADIGIHNQHILPRWVAVRWDEREEETGFGACRCTCVCGHVEGGAGGHRHSQPAHPAQLACARWSFVDLPELTAGVYMVELQRRVNQFLLAVPPQHPLPHVKNLLHATADVEDRLMLWGHPRSLLLASFLPPCHLEQQGALGLDARELFGVYVEAWIRERTHTLMDVCRAPKQWRGGADQRSPLVSFLRLTVSLPSNVVGGATIFESTQKSTQWAVLASMSDCNATSSFMEEVYGVINSLLRVAPMLISSPSSLACFTIERLSPPTVGGACAHVGPQRHVTIHGGGVRGDQQLVRRARLGAGAMAAVHASRGGGESKQWGERRGQVMEGEEVQCMGGWVRGVINSLLDELDSVLGRWPQYTLLVEESAGHAFKPTDISSLASLFQNFHSFSSSAPSSPPQHPLLLLSTLFSSSAPSSPPQHPLLLLSTLFSSSHDWHVCLCAISVFPAASPLQAVCDVERAAISSLASHFQNFLLLLNTPSSSSAPSSTSTKKKLLNMLSRRRPTLAYQVPIESHCATQLAAPSSLSSPSPRSFRPVPLFRKCPFCHFTSTQSSPSSVPLNPAPNSGAQCISFPPPVLSFPLSPPHCSWEYPAGSNHITEESAQGGPFLLNAPSLSLPSIPSLPSSPLQTQLGRTTSLKRVLKEVRPQAGDDMTSKLQPLSALIGSLLAQADAVLSSRVFVGTARGLWDRHGREVLKFPTLSVLPSPTPFFPSHQADAVLSSRVFVGTARVLWDRHGREADAVLSSRVFVGTARGLWDRHGREVLHFLEKRREGVSWFKSASAAITLDTLDNLFTQQMQRLQGHSLMERDLEPPRAICDARGVLSKGGAPAATARVHDSLSLY